MKALLVLNILMVTFLSVEKAQAHALLLSPVPRDTDSGNTVAPCGGYAHTTPTAYQAGSTITVQWQQVIAHSGSFQLYFSPANDANLSTGPTPGSTLLYQVANSDTGRTVPFNYSAQITLPKTTCTDCTLQFVQVNTDTPGAPVYYMNCADIVLTTYEPSPTPAPTGPGNTPRRTAAWMAAGRRSTCSSSRAS